MSENMTNPSRSRDLVTQTMTHSVFYILENKTGKLINYGQLQRYPKYAETWKKCSPMKWGDYTKELVKLRMALANELMEQIHLIPSVLKTYQRTVLTQYDTLQ